ncbi:MAG: acireductone synthase [Acetobacteraceae bacterium]|nr:acireductone synthase [Acetobacteraceae bacterium]
MGDPVRLVVTDIEGTTSPIAFVKEELFPFAERELGPFLAARAEDPAVAAVLADVAARAPGEAPEAALRRWMAADEKVTPLKTLQGMIWEAGFRDGRLRGRLWPEVPPHLRAWRAGGVRLAVFSSGSVAAQRLLFGFSEAGDLTPLFDGFFDTTTGPKREAASYRAILSALGAAAGESLFLSDVEAELDAAAEAGLRTCQLVRPEDGTRPGARHPVAPDFAAVAARFGLPQGG